MQVGTAWLVAAGVAIPTCCLGDSCIASVPGSRQGLLLLELVTDPFW